MVRCKIPHLVALYLKLSQAYEKETDHCVIVIGWGIAVIIFPSPLALSFDFMHGAL